MFFFSFKFKQCYKNKLKIVKIWNVMFFILLYRFEIYYSNLLHDVRNEKKNKCNESYFKIHMSKLVKEKHVSQ